MFCHLSCEDFMRRGPILPLAALATSFGIIALLLYSPLGRSSPIGTQAGKGVISSRDAAAISGILLGDLFTKFRAHTGVIDDSTTTIGRGEFVRLPQETPDDSFAPALADYVAKNQVSDVIDLDGIPVPDGVHLVASPKPRMAARDTLSIGLSRIGFNHAHTRAVVYLGVGCGALCGQGDIVWLKRDAGGQWLIFARQMLWVS